MGKAQICPVCKGRGTVPIDTIWSASYQEERTCHGCNGVGWVEVSD